MAVVPRTSGQWPPVTSQYAPADYADDWHRGTVEHDPVWPNYSTHAVTVKDGTIVTNANFAQFAPNTDAINPGQTKDALTFVDCNLVNVALHPSWTLKDCNTTQVWFVVPPLTATSLPIDTQYLCSDPASLTGPMLIAPPTVVKPAVAVVG